jgi:hypothetical protein
MCKQVTQVCNKCQEELPYTEEYFANNQSTNTGGDKYLRPDCRKCWNTSTKGRSTAYKNAGEPEYPIQGYVEEQLSNGKTKKHTKNGYPCDKCGKTHYSRKVVFDHCHTNLTHRGWLCDSCNRALGMLGDDVIGVGSGAAYIATRTNMTREEYLKIQGELYDKYEKNPLI